MMQQSHDERRMNMNTQLPEKINTFFENCKKNDVHPIPKDPHFNNLYLIQSVDMDGNVTNEKFGFNELTGLGIRNICWWGAFKEALPNYQIHTIIHILMIPFHQYTMIPARVCQLNITNSKQ